MKTIFGHYIHEIKKDKYIFFEDYKKLVERIGQLSEIINDTGCFVECLYKGGYITEATQNNILERLKDRKEVPWYEN